MRGALQKLLVADARRASPGRRGSRMSDYTAFLSRKAQTETGDGFDPEWVPDFLFPFQQDLIRWGIRMGRAGIFADCGLGKTPMQLVWAENVRRHTGKPVLVVTPLAVSFQTCAE